MRNRLVFIGIIAVLSLLIGCTSGITDTSEPPPALQETPNTTEPTDQTTDTSLPEASVIIDSIITKYREFKRFENADVYIYDIEAYGHASGPVGAVMWTTVQTPTPLMGYGNGTEDWEIQAPSWTPLYLATFQREAGQPETTNWTAIYPGWCIDSDRFDGWYNVADVTVRVAEELYGTVLASETKTITCLRSPSEN